VVKPIGIANTVVIECSSPRAAIQIFNTVDGSNNSHELSQFWRLEVRQQGITRLVPLRGKKEVSVSGLSPFLADGYLLPVSLHCLTSAPVYVLISSEDLL
jgi:hypothetical protein